EILRPVDADVGVPLELLALLVEVQERAATVLVLPAEDRLEGVRHLPGAPLDLNGVAAVCRHGCPPPRRRALIRVPSLPPPASRVQAPASRPAARPVDLPEARQGRGQLQVAAEAFEAGLVCEPFLHAMDELVDRRVARIAQLETAALPAFLA